MVSMCRPDVSKCVYGSRIGWWWLNLEQDEPCFKGRPRPKGRLRRQALFLPMGHPERLLSCCSPLFGGEPANSGRCKANHLIRSISASSNKADHWGWKPNKSCMSGCGVGNNKGTRFDAVSDPPLGHGWWTISGWLKPSLTGGWIARYGVLGIFPF